MNSSTPDTGRDETPDEIDKRVGEAKQERLQLTAKNRDLVGEVAALLFAADPIGIDFGSNADEYTTEAEVIVIGLPGAADADDVTDLVLQTFVVWFSEKDAGPRERYVQVAADIWAAWQRRGHGVG